jgi:methionyl-tRNA formyltransferase
VNIHSSLLPKYRGAAPIAAALVNGEQETGVTFMVMDAGVDTGPILAQSSLYIAERETTVTLHQRLQALAAEHIASVFREWLDGRLIARPQPSTGSSLAPKITKDDGRATWDSAVLWERKIRAYAPWPGVWAFWRDRLIKLHEARAEAGRPTTPPGTIEPISQAPGWRIACADGWLIPLSVQFSDRRPQPAASVIGSYPGFVGGRLTEAVIPPAGTSQ